MMLEAVKSLKHLPFGGAKAIRSHVVKNYIAEIAPMLNELSQRDELVGDFLTNYSQWLTSSRENDFIGLDKLPYRCLSAGTTEAFDKWYIRQQKRRLRIFRGEYMYHVATHRNLNLEYAWLDDEPLRSDDHVVVSMPFADSGGLHPQLLDVLEIAHTLKVPVLIDSAYMGVCQNLSFDFSHPAIDTIAVSLSKTFPVAHARIGMRLCRHDLDDGLDIYRKTAYENRWSAALGLKLIEKFNVDYNVSCYGTLQKSTCKELGIQASPTVLFGLGGEEWQHYSRGGSYNRLFLGKMYEEAS